MSFKWIQNQISWSLQLKMGEYMSFPLSPRTIASSQILLRTLAVYSSFHWHCVARLWVQGHSKQQWSLQCICVSPHYRYDGEHNRNQMCSVQVMLSDLVQNCVHSKHSWKYWNSISRSEYWSSGLRYSCYSRSLAILYQLCEDWKDFAFNELRLSKWRSSVFKHSKWRDICSRISSFGESIRKTGTPYLSRPRVAFLHQPVMRLWLDMLLGKDSSHCQSS